MNKDEKIGYHKGALECLIKEKAELTRLLTIVDALIKMHGSALEEEGIDLEQLVKDIQSNKVLAESQVDEDNFVDFQKELESMEKDFGKE